MNRKNKTLWILQEHQCQHFEINKTQYLDSFYCKIKKENLVLYFKNTKYIIPANQTISLKNQYFYYETKSRHWNCKKIESNYIFGRQELLENHPWISQQQFKIENGILTHMGKNPTYVNGKQSEICQLSAGDEIVVHNCIIYYFKHWIICSHTLKNQDILQYDAAIKKTYKQKKMQPISYTIYELERFAYERETPEIPLFQTISSSSMMLISTFVGIFIQIQMQPERVHDILWMSITSLSMAITCIAFGCISRSTQNKRNKQQKEKEESQYKKYVNDTLQKSKEQLYLKNGNFTIERNQWNELDTSLCNRFETTFQIPIQIHTVQESLLILPEVKYNQVQSSIYQYLLQIKKQSFVQVYTWKYFESGKKTWIQTSRYQDVFIRFAWTCPQWKWIWIGNVEERYTWHPICMSEHQRLWIKTKQDLPLLHKLSEVPCVLCVLEPEFLEAIPESFKKNLVYISEKKTAEPFEVIYSGLDLNPCTIDILRNPPLKKTNSGLHWNHTFAIENMYDLSIQNIRKNQKSLQIPIGFYEREIITLDLNDAHGLVAGTTGSGKSEFLTSLLFQLCIRYSSKNVQYILMDFKGGAFSYAFEQFSHCAGVVTNLDQGEMERFQKSLQSEIEKRQKKMSKFLKCHPNQTAHIDTYNQYEETMTHLFIIVDEFAQLKTMYPDLLQYLKEIARIGRSLGIHLILSTQKPSGIVDEQIWANSKFKICFKVQTAMDSREVLMHDKAYYFESSGQFCLQCENKEKYGISLYSQEEINAEHVKHWEYASQKKTIPIQNEKVCEYLTKQLNLVHESRQWIIQPSLQRIESSHTAMIDIPGRQTVQPLKFPYGEVYLVLIHDSHARNQWQQMISSEYENTYIWNEHVKKDSCWHLLQKEENLTLILTDAQYIELFHKKNIRLFYVCESYSSMQNHSFSYKFASSWNDIESMQNIFHRYQMDYQKYPYGWVQQRDEIYWMKWKTQINEQRQKIQPCLSIQTKMTKERYHKFFHTLVVGYEKESMLPLVCTRNEPWLFLYKDESKEKEINRLIQLWSVEDQKNIQVCNIHNFQTSFVQCENIVWFGYGSQEYTHLLNKKMIFEESSLTMWKANQVYKGEPLLWSE